MSLPPEERVELLAILAADTDANLAERAKNAALAQPLLSFVTAISRPEADPRLFVYCAANLAEKPGIADAMAKNPNCPSSLLVAAASHLTSEGIQALLDNLAWVEHSPQLVHALHKSTATTSVQREMLDDMIKGALSDKEIEAATDGEADPTKRKTLMQKLAFMNVVQRLTLARKGGREERMLLIRDPNKLVQKSVLQSPRLTDTEVESFAGMANLSVDVLRSISLNRLFLKNYAVARNLVFNPKTPLDISLHLFSRLTITDLVKLAANKNVPDTVRSMAQKLHRKRKAGGGNAG
ncbi:MAG: hypothetical protein ACRD8A_09140 [Candidatus Acidiferrales bacterium]